MTSLHNISDLVENNFPTDLVRPELVEGLFVETFRSPFDCSTGSQLRANGRKGSNIKLNFGKLFVAKSVAPLNRFHPIQETSRT